MSELESLRAEVARLKAQQASRVKVMISDKSGGIMVTGLRKFPITFYKEEWVTLFAMRDQIETVMRGVQAKA